MSRMLEMLFLAVANTSTLWFIYAALAYMESFDKKNRFLKDTSLLYLSGIIVTGICLINASSGGYKSSNICSLGVLLVVAVIDETTGYIYDWWNYLLLAGTMLFSLSGVANGLTEREWKLIFLYLIIVILMGVLHGVGAGDVPLLMALLLYYLRTATFPADAAIFQLLLSVGIGVVRCLVNRKKWMPLAPAICLAHLFTVCVWI